MGAAPSICLKPQLWSALWLASAGRAPGVDPERYVKVINGRCEEQVGALPLGGSGQNWTRNTDSAAREWCNRQPWCVGYMRYLGKDAQHCHAWCGCPQFCRSTQLEQDENWASYMRASALLDGAVEGVEAASQAASSSAVPRRVECPWPYEGSLLLWSDEAPHGLEAPDLQNHSGEEGCHVLHHKQGLQLEELRRKVGQELQGILSEDETVVSHFSADTSVEPWAYSVDRNEYSGESFGPKLHYLSMFFLSADSTCDGKVPQEWGPKEAEGVMPGHVFVEDGSVEMRHRAFRPYHFTIICGSLNESGFVPQALVDALSCASHPLVVKRLHDVLHRAFFHLPDAVQAYTRIHPLMLEEYLERLYTDPAKNDAMYYKQTFLFLLQDLFRYRYRQAFRQRLVLAACALCQERQRVQRLRVAEPEMEARFSHQAVGVAVCVMSRRQGHVLRTAIRETWGTSISGSTALRFFVGAAADDEVAVVDAGAGDVVELHAPEAYKAVSQKAFSMLEWAFAAFPNLRFLVRSDDDVYLRTGPLLAQLQQRPPVMYFWGNFDHGSNPVRDPGHPHYNSLQQFPERHHPLFGDIFPPYARGHLWVMSVDLLTMVVDVWRKELSWRENLPHPDDPALGIVLSNLVDKDLLSLNIDDRDLNYFSLNPSCNATYLNVHARTWVVHHVDADAMRCMWAVDRLAESNSESESGPFPDLCPCSMDVVEDVDDLPGEEKFDYPRYRFNE